MAYGSLVRERWSLDHRDGVTAGRAALQREPFTQNDLQKRRSGCIKILKSHNFSGYETQGKFRK